MTVHQILQVYIKEDNRESYKKVVGKDLESRY